MKLTKHPKTKELQFPASVIDGTALALSDILKAKFPEPSIDLKLAVFCLEEFYKFLGLAVQSKSEEEFRKMVVEILNHNKQN